MLWLYRRRHGFFVTNLALEISTERARSMSSMSSTRTLNLSPHERALRAGHVEALRRGDDMEPETSKTFRCATRGRAGHPRLVDARIEGGHTDAGSGPFRRLDPLADATSR
jgi:hypothetical protein